MKLIEFTEFINEIDDYVRESHNYKDAYNLISNYNKILNLELKLWMFVVVEDKPKPIFKCQYFTRSEMPNFMFYETNDAQIFNTNKDGSHLYWYVSNLNQLFRDANYIELTEMFDEYNYHNKETAIEIILELMEDN